MAGTLHSVCQSREMRPDKGNVNEEPIVQLGDYV